MLALFFFFKSIASKLRAGWKDDEFRGMFWTVLIVVAVGTWFYRSQEGWSWVDSFYFTMVTLTTVGYGDFSPTQPITKLFTVFYLIIGVGLLSTFVIKMATMSGAGGLLFRNGPLAKERLSEKGEESPDVVDDAATNHDSP
jgi:voltage-gated potassium channel Kch